MFLLTSLHKSQLTKSSFMENSCVNPKVSSQGGNKENTHVQVLSTLIIGNQNFTMVNKVKAFFVLFFSESVWTERSRFRRFHILACGGQFYFYFDRLQLRTILSHYFQLNLKQKQCSTIC